MRVVLLLVLLVGCYDPSLAPCAVRCSQASDCAGGLSCGADGWCASGERLDRCDQLDAIPAGSDATLTVDSPPGVDAPTDASPQVDAAPLQCAPGCNGTCENGVCVIRCSGPNACNADVKCPPTGPCRVECTGNMSCPKKVVCGAGDCDVMCMGPSSCKGGVQCEDACACDVTCSGTNSCEKAATCPASACDTGSGCTSSPSTCDSCPAT